MLRESDKDSIGAGTDDWLIYQGELSPPSQEEDDGVRCGGSPTVVVVVRSASRGGGGGDQRGSLRSPPYGASGPLAGNYSLVSVAHSRGDEGGEEDVLRARGLELVHDVRRVLFGHERLDRNPVGALERRDGGRVLARRDALDGLEVDALDVVGDHEVLVRRDIPRDAFADRLDELVLARVRVRDEHRLRRHDHRDLLEPRGLHRRPRLDEVDDAVGEPEPAGRLDRARDDLDARWPGRTCPRLERREVRVRQLRERRRDALPDEITRI
mmetsp:Transcript_21342/g.84887  ORF Transcript_21342/g.84887 Transcript_21342/m.84887 type:complete len:269 (-) Transcript_21342:382-1188(-)